MINKLEGVAKIAGSVMAIVGLIVFVIGSLDRKIGSCYFCDPPQLVVVQETETTAYEVYRDVVGADAMFTEESDFNEYMSVLLEIPITVDDWGDEWIDEQHRLYTECTKLYMIAQCNMFPSKVTDSVTEGTVPLMSNDIENWDRIRRGTTSAY